MYALVYDDITHYVHLLSLVYMSTSIVCVCIYVCVCVFLPIYIYTYIHMAGGVKR